MHDGAPLSCRPRARTLFLVTAVLALTACTGDITGPSPIVTGTWTVEAGPGFSGSFNVADGPARVTSVRLDWDDWRCGTVTVRGYTRVTPQGGLEIIDRDIHLRVAWGNADAVTFVGRFADDGAHASGTWSASVAGRSCSGSWEAVCP